MPLPYGEITSFLVSRGDELVIEEYGDGDKWTLRNTRSCTKTVLSMLMGIAIERGLVTGVEAAIGDLLPDRVTGATREITVEQLLTMSSCLDCNDWDDASPGREDLMYPRDDWVQFAVDLPLRAERAFSYCTAGVVLLGAALEHVLGEPLPDFARRELFAPLGIERFDWPTTPRGETSCAGGLLLTSRDLLELGRLYLRGGGDLVPAAWIERSTRAHARIDGETEYGYLWWLRSFAGRRSFSMAGMGGSRVQVVPELELVAVVTAANFARRDAHQLTDRLLVDRALDG